MNIAKLERMIAVYEAGSFRKAATILGLSQPALTWSIRQLEENLNLPLFVRGPRGITPTEACERLVVRARLIVNEQARLIAEVERSSRVHTLTLGLHPILITPAFARALARFHEIHDDVTIQVIDGFSSHLQERLRQGDLDLAVCATAVRTDLQDEFAFEPLLLPSYSVYAVQDHPIFAEIATGSAERTHNWAQVAVPNVLSDQERADEIMPTLQRLGMTPQKATIRSPSVQLVRTMVEYGGVLGMLPDELMERDLANKAVRRIEKTQFDGPPLGLLTISGSYQTRALRQLMSILRKALRRPPIQ